ncbi:Crp/Fnr family transcriptional regulator [Sphingomonas sp. LM7]|uniref:Crp/Fnr family transcriptional regulator n=1 Tax=Sphingomonas sp. LM7 TaxID=1938607 RepID=UPI000983E589|nr:Crp/Fnr family transcriptional regulator [Sphingomonas sp. LM7]AQR72629.1 hypothetical protein BXU08_02165 [Sphingomonas sp. LM7]
MTSPTGLFFEGLPPELLTRLLESGARRSHAAGEALFHEEDPASQLLVIVEGQVRVWRTSPRGSAMTVHLLGPGDLPGVAAVVQRTPYPATASAVTPVRTLGWPAERALSMLFDHPSLATNTMRFISLRNEEMLQRLHEVSTQPVEQRLARAVLRLTDNDTRSVDISRQELAELTATTLHTVSRIVSRWETEGVIDAARRRITLIEGRALGDRAGVSVTE